MPSIGDIGDAAYIVASLRFYAANLKVGDWVALPQHPPPLKRFRGKRVGESRGVRVCSWEHGLRAARRLAMVSLKQTPHERLYRIRKDLWDTVRMNLVMQSQFHGREFDNWILASQTQARFLALPVVWKLEPYREFMENFGPEFLERTKRFWKGATGRSAEAGGPCPTGEDPAYDPGAEEPRKKTLKDQMKAVLWGLENS